MAGKHGRNGKAHRKHGLISNKSKKKELITHFDFIHFVEIEQKPKTKVYACRISQGCADLGIVKWFPRWRKYCFFPEQDTIYDGQCLNNIIQFLDALNA